jgi:uncharacterized protein YjbI with pentapeptide repeats
MANPVFVGILRYRVRMWNQLRERKIITTADLSGADLSGCDLSELDLHGVNLNWANLSGVNLNKTDLSRARLRGADLSDADLSNTNLSEADLRRASLRRVISNEANLSEANLIGAKLVRAQFTFANLSKANFGGADLSGANLSDADLTGCDFSGASFNRVNLKHADLSQAVFRYTDIMDTDLSTTVGLETTQHQGPSTLGIDTIYRSNGQVADIFWRGCGIPDDMIAYIRSIAGAIQYYTVSISYNREDSAFADRMYNDLQGKGIRCWRDKDKPAATDPVWEIIDQSVNVFDKILVVLSTRSLNDPQVERQVKQALEKEVDLRHHTPDATVLFPICLDDAITTTSVAWARDLQSTHQIKDFSQWEDYDAYGQQFTELLDELKLH